MQTSKGEEAQEAQERAKRKGQHERNERNEINCGAYSAVASAIRVDGGRVVPLSTHNASSAFLSFLPSCSLAFLSILHVLETEFPENAAIEFHTADDHVKAVGRCIAAAALPPARSA